MTTEIKDLPSFSDVEKALEIINAESGAAETHGLLTSLFCGGVKMRQEAWFDSMLSARSEPGDIMLAAAKKDLTALFEVTSSNIKSDDYEFQLLLPNDDESFYLRVEALSQWCQGFVTGLNLQGISADKIENNNDLQEALEDLLKISCLRYEEDELSDEEGESAYAELVEYARVAVILLYNSIDSLPSGDNA